jgi:hypothetical protein
LKNARKEVAKNDIAGQFVAARRHLMNFIRDLQRLVDQQKVSAAAAQPLLDGAAAILEQIEGSHPKPGAGGPVDEQ